MRRSKLRQGCVWYAVEVDIAADQAEDPGVVDLRLTERGAVVAGDVAPVNVELERPHLHSVLHLLYMMARTQTVGPISPIPNPVIHQIVGQIGSVESEEPFPKHRASKPTDHHNFSGLASCTVSS